MSRRIGVRRSGSRGGGRRRVSDRDFERLRTGTGDGVQVGGHAKREHI